MMMSADCMLCVVKHHWERVKDYPEHERVKSAFMRDIMALVAEHAHDISPQRIDALINQAHIRYFGRGEDMSAEKLRYNRHLLNLEPRLRAQIDTAPDPLLSAICHAQAGNYIDFATVNVDDDELFALLERAQSGGLPEARYLAFLKDLAAADTLVYLCDNAGEIVLDKLLIERLKAGYPNLRITAVVRGAEVMNDATLRDAEDVGLTDAVHVIGNGTPFAGTELAFLPDGVKALIESADVVISKGQGNFETLAGCGLNIYYMFLCKCDWFVKRFGQPKNAPMFINEREVTISPYID